jgi:hypothetical protein
MAMIDADFPGGNILVDGETADEVVLRPDFRGSGGWFYWCFRARGYGARRVTFRFNTKVHELCPYGPAVSTDAGATWRWLGADSADFAGNAFSYLFTGDEAEVRFCFSLPYLEPHLRAFVARQDAGRLVPRVLCRSERGRDVELLEVRSRRAPLAKALLTCRHHACEATATFVLEGLLDAVLHPSDPETAFLADHVELLAVPFVDKDGVEDGDQGKDRRPRDHNRDYAGESIHASTRALRELVPAWGGDKLTFCLDLHCPHVDDEPQGKVFFVGQENPAQWRELAAFSAILEALPGKALPYRAEANIPYGVGWNSGRNYAQGKSCSTWCMELPGMRLATAVEIPYSNAGGVALDGTNTRAFGRNLAQALGRYLRPG